MATVYPDDVRFIMEEDFREEAGNKLILLGVFAGDDINIPAGEKAGKVISPLAFTIICRNASGKFKVTFEIIDPNDNKLLEDVLPKNIDLEAPLNQNVVFQIKLPFLPVTEFGKYKARLFFDDRKYEYSFNVNKAPASNAPASETAS